MLEMFKLPLHVLTVDAVSVSVAVAVTDVAQLFDGRRDDTSVAADHVQRHVLPQLRLAARQNRRQVNVVERCVTSYLFIAYTCICNIVPSLCGLMYMYDNFHL